MATDFAKAQAKLFLAEFLESNPECSFREARDAADQVGHRLSPVMWRWAKRDSQQDLQNWSPHQLLPVVVQNKALQRSLSLPKWTYRRNRVRIEFELPDAPHAVEFGIRLL